MKFRGARSRSPLSRKDPIYAGVWRSFRKLIPGAKDQPEIVVQRAGHFLLEEKGDEVARQIEAFLDRTRAG